MGGVVTRDAHDTVYPTEGSKRTTRIGARIATTLRRASKLAHPSHSSPLNPTKPELAGKPNPPVGLERASSLNEVEVAEKNQQWMVKQQASLEAMDVTDWEAVFDGFCREVGREELSVDELNALFTKFGTRVNRPMLRLLFSLFDADQNNVVDKNEFLVSVCFLTQATANSDSEDIIDLAYFIFDSNRSNSISKREFNDMCIVLCNRARFVLGVTFLRAAFRAHLEEEHNEENLLFIEHMEGLQATTRPRSDSRPLMISKAQAQAAYDKFISQEAETQVNVSSHHRVQVAQALEETAGDEVSTYLFDACVSEILGLLESDALPRFKDKIKGTIADKVWEEEKFAPEAQMDKAQFRAWAEKYPGLFSFLEDLKLTLQRAAGRQKRDAATRIQRTFRRHQGTVYVLGMVKKLDG